LITGGLFTGDFLIEGILSTPHWQGLDDHVVAETCAKAATLFAKLTEISSPNEQVTEKDLIYPLLAAIGWDQRVYVQPNASVKGRADVPDALLFADDESLARARREWNDWQRFKHGLCVVEAKRWNRLLDRVEKGKEADEGVPSTQMLRYLRRADDVTEGGLRWGVLTNGRIWRLYWQGALSVAEDFLEIDLGKAFNLPGCEFDLLDRRPNSFADDEQWRAHAFKLFVMMFGPGAFIPQPDGQTFHESARREGKFWESRVAKSLSDSVFDVVFPSLASAITKADPQRPRMLSQPYFAEVREAALILLYRLLFVLYAEDRNLLPEEIGPYADFCLRRIRLEIADRKVAGRQFSESFVTYWPRLTSIFRVVAKGDDALGIPPYNGGLFESATAPILDRVQLPDPIVADVIFGLSHEADIGRGPKYISYRDLSVQQLGSVHERILEFGLRRDGKGGVEIDADDEARHRSGSYYTPDDLVSLVITKAVGPLVTERVAAFEAKAKELESSHLTKQERLATLTATDPAASILALKICDPAMGSGHFLVSLVDWLADAVLRSMAEASELVRWGDYISPLAKRIADIREKISSQAEAHHWPIVHGQLDDRRVVRRMVLKRVVHGVDKNPMAVELAKVSLWLHSFTVGAPLSFLDHHLRCGDSVIGAFVRPTLEALKERGGLFNVGEITRVEQVASVMSEIEQSTDNDVAEVARSKEKFTVVEDVIRPIEALFSLLTAERLMGVFDGAPRKEPDLRKLVGKTQKQIAKARADAEAFENAAAFQVVLEGAFGAPASIAMGDKRVAPPELVKQYSLSLERKEDAGLFPAISVDDRRRVIADGLVEEARALEVKERFFHWKIGFPNVWRRLVSAEPDGGFDAIIGNPPYVRHELLAEDIKRALKESYKAYDGMADLYVYFFEQGLHLLRPGGRMGYVVTNKWLKAGYAENLRGLFADDGWLEFVADFGHAKHFFPDADVFPSVLVVQKPEPAKSSPQDVQICVIPRDAVPKKSLAEAVAEAIFPLPRAVFTKESWVLGPKPVMDLLQKIKTSGVPLGDYAGLKPLYGIKTGLNEAFLIDTPTRDRLVRDDPNCAGIIKPYLRGQDIERWYAPWKGLWMVFSRRGLEIDKYPSVKAHLERFRIELEPKPEDWEPEKPDAKWPGRKEGNYAWYEIQDSVDYWEQLERAKIVYVDIAWSASFCIDTTGLFVNNTVYFIPSGDPWIAAVLNAPVGWAYSWRCAQHGKDEALRYFNTFVETYPIPARPSADVDTMVACVAAARGQVALSRTALLDWLRHEFSLEKPGGALAQPHDLDADAFVAAVRKALPRSKKLSAAEIARLKQEHRVTVEPARGAAREALALERRLSDIVNAAYGLTPEDVALMWATAPPRMPFTPSDPNAPT